MFTKRVRWVLMIGVLYLGMMGASVCGKNAKIQIDSANNALEQARAVGAKEYAPNEYSSAENSLLMARQDYDKRRYKSAEEQAKAAEAQAKLAQQRALEEKARRQEEERKREEAEAKARAEAEAAAGGYNISSLPSDTVAEPPIPPSSLEEEARVALYDIHFDYDSASLSDSAKEILKINADWLQAHPTVRVEIEGHCDERGSEEYNLALGAKRAKAVYDYLVKLGVDPNRMRYISYGESVPVDPGHDETAWAQNRRVHFAILPPENP